MSTSHVDWTTTERGRALIEAGAQPTTVEGRDMLAHAVQYDPRDADKQVIAAKIAAIEAEAAASVRAELLRAAGLRITGAQITEALASLAADRFGSARDEAYVRVAAEGMVAILDAATEPSSEPEPDPNIERRVADSLALSDALRSAEPRTWPTREDFRRMSSVEVNAFFESIGSDWRVADFPAPSPATPSTPLDVAVLPGTPCRHHSDMGFTFSVLGCPKCYPFAARLSPVAVEGETE